MNFIKNRLSIAELFVITAIIALVAAITIPAFIVRADNTSPYALAPQQPNFYRFDTNTSSYALQTNTTVFFPHGWTNGFGPNTNVLNLPLRQGQGLSIFLITWQTNSISSASTSTNYTVSWDVTPDNTNYTFTGTGGSPISLTSAMAGLGIGTNVVWTNIPSTALNNVRAIQPGKIVWTGSNNVFAQIIYSYSGQ